ncbi:MAG: glycosyltransferase family 4 protein [Aquabacterium sp.]
MKVVLSTIGKFHTFDLARELQAHGALERIYSGYPAFKLKGEELPVGKVATFPWIHGPYMAWPGRERLGPAFNQAWERLDSILFDRYVAARLPRCQVFVGLSGSALRTGRVAKRLGARYVCDRGSTHIRVQDKLLREEHAQWGVPFDGIAPHAIEREEQEYASADCITVPSSFNVRSFIDQGVPAHKIQRLPYGVNLGRFRPTRTPQADAFNVLFVGGMSLRKGLPYLMSAYKQLQHPRKSLTLAGAASPDFIRLLKAHQLWSDDIRVLGHVPQPELKDLMSSSHVMVLPSIEEGLAMVQAQAMACACPVIATTHTGAEDLFTDGVDGFIAPVRSAHAITEKLQYLADHPDERARMSAAALQRVTQAGGWRDYGNRAMDIYRSLVP